MGAANILTTMPNKSSSDAAWIAWYDSLSFGKDDNSLFIHVWKANGTKAANTVALRKHLAENGLNLAPDNALGSLADFEHGVLDSIGSVFKVSGITFAIVGGVVIVFLGAIVWRTLTPENTGVIIGTAAKSFV